MGLFKPIRIRKKDIVFAVFGGLVFAIPTMYIIPNNDPALSLTLNFSLFFLLSVGNGAIAEAINISWIEYPAKRFFFSLIVFMAYTLLASAVVLVAVAYLFYRHPPLQALRTMDPSYYPIVVGITIFISLFQFGREFLLNWRESEIRAIKLREAHIAAQYESLQNQVNPHFLFNSLNVLSTLVYRDQDLATKFIKQLSKVYRYVLEAKNKEVVPLATEMEALEAYVFLVKIRFGEGIVFENKLPDQLTGHIAPLSLQMLVENAVKHNTANKEQPLIISINEADGFVTVQNNLQKKNQEQKAMGIGLANIQTRYQYLSDQPVTIEEKSDSFKVNIPLIRVEQAADLYS